MGGIRVRKNFKFADSIDQQAPTAKLMHQAGTELTVNLVNRTLSGLDEDGQPFAPYANDATKFGQSTVDLHDTGQMLADLSVIEATKRRFRIGFRTRRSERIADLHMSGTSRMPARRFLGIDPRWIDAIVAKVFRRR